MSHIGAVPGASNPLGGRGQCRLIHKKSLQNPVFDGRNDRFALLRHNSGRFNRLMQYPGYSIIRAQA